MEHEYKYYYKFLVKNFGHIEFKGTTNLAYTLMLYETGEDLQKTYEKVANQVKSTPAAVERSIRFYLNRILKDVTKEELSLMLDYSFSIDASVKPAEFILALKLALDDKTLE